MAVGIVRFHEHALGDRADPLDAERHGEASFVAAVASPSGGVGGQLIEVGGVDITVTGHGCRVPAALQPADGLPNRLHAWAVEGERAHVEDRSSPISNAVSPASTVRTSFASTHHG